MRNTQHTSLECASIEIFFLMPGKFHGCRSLVGYSPWHHKESDTTEQLFTSLFTRVELLLVLWGNPLYRDVHPYHPASREHAVDMDLDDMTEALSTMFLHYKLFLPFYSWLLGVVVEVLVVQSRLTLCDSMDCSPPDSYRRWNSQARILEWVAISSSKGSSGPKDGNQGLLQITVWASWEGSLYLQTTLKEWGVTLEHMVTT